MSWDQTDWLTAFVDELCTLRPHLSEPMAMAIGQMVYSADKDPPREARYYNELVGSLARREQRPPTHIH